MADPFIAEIRIFAGNFAPRAWAFCDGQLLPIAQNTALFALVGTIYGGDGRTTFGLPNLQGRLPMHPGSGPGLMSRALGEHSGVEMVTLSAAQLANHSHVARGHLGPGDDDEPTSALPAVSVGANVYAPAPAARKEMAPESLLPVGGGQPHANVQPYLALNFIIAILGIFPSRS